MHKSICPDLKLSTLDFLPLGVCALTPELDIVFWNKRLEEWTKLSRSKTIGTKLTELFPNLQHKKYKLRFQQIFNDRCPVVLSSKLHNSIIPACAPNGMPQVQRITVSPITTKDSAKIIALLAIEDVTELNGQINAYKEIRNIALQREKESRQAAEAKAIFLANMSHEIRTPLNGIIGMLELMEESDSPQQLAEFIQIAKSSANNLRCLINDVLDTSKMEAGMFSINPEPTDIRSLIRMACAPLELMAENADLTFFCQVDENVPAMLSLDPARFTQVLNNLIGNAIKFTPRGGAILLSASSLKVSNQVCKLEIRVTDSGIGVKNTDHERIFKAFEQAEQNSTKAFGGTGLGLSISKKLIETMKGTIQVKSQVNVGTTFCLQIPLPICDTPKTHEEIEPVKNGSSASDIINSAPKTQRHILLVEDNLINQKVMNHILIKLGHNVSFALNGKEAVEKTQSDQFDLVLMDCHMPVMSGYQATEIIRSKENLRTQSTRLPIVALTASLLEEDRKHCMKCGMDAFLTKPIKAQELQHIIEELTPTNRESDL